MGFVANSPTKALVVKRMEELTEQNQEISNRIRELEELIASNALSDAQFDLLRQMLSVFRTSIDEMSVEEKRVAIQSVVRKVVWDGVNAHVVLFGADENEIEYPDLNDRFYAEDDQEHENEEFDDSAAYESPWGEGSKMRS